ncbi:hypothetical protein CEXT_420071 [Caerostris extrusa]|uniref:Uncharacterized protein n=1 Tax=Caerostris extrusa TaxID=172846 RepID=A0AAV4XF47_CAEEX|nr:hypothetical protein CEXT_420071 [Caerostris extrusa]
MAPQQNRLLNKQDPGMIEYRLLCIRSLMNNEHVTRSNVDEGEWRGIVHQEIVCPDHRLGLNDPKETIKTAERSLMNNEHLTHSNVDEGGGPGDGSPRDRLPRQSAGDE